MKKITILFSLFLLICMQSYAQLKWSQTIGTDSSYVEKSQMFINDVKIDSKGNSYILTLQNSPDLLTFYLTGYHFQPNYNFPVLLLIKLDTAGQLLWVKSLAQQYNSNDGCLAIDKDGNAYVAAGYYKKAYVDQDTLVSYSEGGMYCVKFDKDGNRIWLKNTFSSGWISKMEIDKDGYIYFTGNYGGFSMLFGNVYIKSQESPQLFVMKMDKDGQMQWGADVEYYKYGWKDYGNPISMKIGPDGNIYGLFAQGGRNTISSCEYQRWHFILACLDIKGNVLWEKDYSCSDLITASDMDISPFGDIIVIGRYRGTFDFGNTSITSPNGNYNCHFDEAFIAKFDNKGNTLFANKVSNDKYTSDLYQIHFNKDATYDIAGLRHYSKSSPHPGHSYPNGTSRVFIAKYDYLGNELYVSEFYKNHDVNSFEDTNPRFATDADGNYIMADNTDGQYDTLPHCFYDEAQNLMVFKFNKNALKYDAPSYLQTNILLAPNPVRNVLYVSIRDSNFLQYQYIIKDMSGRLVWQDQKSDPSFGIFPINVSALAPGMYVIQIHNEKGDKTEKFIKD